MSARTRRKSKTRHAGACWPCMGLSTLEHENLGHADEQIARLDEQLSNLGFDTARQTSFSQAHANMSRSPSWARRGLAGLVLATCIAVAAVAWRRPSHDDTATTVHPQPAPQAQTAPEHEASGAPAMPPELTQSLQSMARDLAIVEREIEGLKTNQQQAAGDDAKIAEQFKANQDQMARDIAKLYEQLKAGQEQIGRDIASVTEQLKATQEQMAREIAKVSEQNPPPRIPVPPPRPAVSPTRKPVPTLASPQATRNRWQKSRSRHRRRYSRCPRASKCRSSTTTVELGS